MTAVAPAPQPTAPSAAPALPTTLSALPTTLSALPTRYPGAQPFADTNLSRKLFSGRDHEAVSLTHQILANRLVVLFARSGLGKTSLLNAGVLEPLRAQGLLPLTIRLNDVEHGALASFYAGVRSGCPHQGIEYLAGDDRSLWHFFKTAEFWQGDLLLEPVLILDQFEEIFTLQSEAQRNAFIDQLSCLVRGVRPKLADRADGADGAALGDTALSDAPPRVKIVLSMREDFLAHVEELSDRIPQILDNRFRLLPLTRANAAQAIERPSTVVDPALATPPFRIGEDAKALILDFLQRRVGSSRSLGAAQIEPFQLQLICQYLEESQQRRKDKSASQVLSAVDIGGEASLRRIIKTFYRRQLLTVPFWQRRRVRALCSESLISPGGRRLRLEESEITRLTGVKAPTLHGLVERRLLRVEPSDTGAYYELSHDSLVAPVLESRRVWFLLRTLGLLLMAAASTVVLLSVTAGAASTMFEMQKPAELLIAVPIIGGLVWWAASWLRNRWRDVTEMWRRIRL
jgi:hypothetical protein